MTIERCFSSNLVDRARELARTRGDAPAFTWLRDGEEEDGCLSFADLDAHARKIAAHLGERGLRGERALLSYTPGLEFVAAFLGCLYAGVTAVPMSTPRNDSAASLALAIARHAEPAIRLGDTVALGASWNALGLFAELEKLATDSLSLADGERWSPGPVDLEDVALLQYTSGSTGRPKGVQVTHLNLMRNEAMIAVAFGHGADTRFVSWLPMFHDMGLMGNVLQPLFLGVHGVLMAPSAFVQKPVRWLQAMSRYRATTTGAPNFAYDLCVQRVRPEQMEGLDLSCWRLAYNGSEPVRSGTLERFSAKFAPAGFRREAFYPCYGLAEATLFVSGGRHDAPCVQIHVDGEELAEHRVRPVEVSDPRARSLVGCGRAWLGSRVLIVDPRTRLACDEDQVGEIWVQGEHVARGYRGPPDPEDDSFAARLASGEGPFLRTGDLGFVRDGELFVTGRSKDLVIQNGRNLYPQDLELVAAQSNPALRVDFAAAFGVESEAGERLVLVLEVRREACTQLRQGGSAAADRLRAEVAGEVRAAIAAHFDAHVWRVVLLRHGNLPRTTSGKVQRGKCRDMWVRGELARLDPCHARS